MNSLVLSSNKKIMALSFRNGEIYMLDIEQKKLLKILKPEEFENQDPCIAFTDDNQLLCGTEGDIYKLDWVSGQLNKIPVKHDRKVFYIGRLKSASDDEAYVSCSRDSRIFIFDENSR